MKIIKAKNLGSIDIDTTDVEGYYRLTGMNYSLDTTLSASLQLTAYNQGGNLVCWR